jgi:Peptidase C26
MTCSVWAAAESTSSPSTKYRSNTPASGPGLSALPNTGQTGTPVVHISLASLRQPAVRRSCGARPASCGLPAATATSTRKPPSRDETELPLARPAIAAAIPLLGFCRGMQVINVGLTGSLHPDHSVLPSPADRHRGGDWDVRASPAAGCWSAAKTTPPRACDITAPVACTNSSEQR